jgi:hypothetical protein
MDKMGINLGILNACLFFIAVLMNLRDIVQSKNNVEDLNRIVLPILNASLDFNIQNASNEAIQAIQSGVSFLFYFFIHVVRYVDT